MRRLERQEPLLLSPEQSFFLRENLKLRLLDARMANIQRDGTTFAADIRAARPTSSVISTVHRRQPGALPTA